MDNSPLPIGAYFRIDLAYKKGVPTPVVSGELSQDTASENLERVVESECWAEMFSVDL